MAKPGQTSTRCVLEIQRRHGSFSEWLWRAVPGGVPIVNHWSEMAQVPTRWGFGVWGLGLGLGLGLGSRWRRLGSPTHPPASQPAIQPASQPTSQSASQPANLPARKPTSQPSNQPRPNSTRESEALSKALKAEGFKFVGPVTCYSYMQAGPGGDRGEIGGQYLFWGPAMLVGPVACFMHAGGSWGGQGVPRALPGPRLACGALVLGASYPPLS